MFVEQWIISRKAEHTNASTRICLAKDKVPAFIWIQINHGDSNNTECSSRPFWLQVFVHIGDKKLQMATMPTSFTFELVYRDWGQNHNLITWKWKYITEGWFTIAKVTCGVVRALLTKWKYDIEVVSTAKSTLWESGTFPNFRPTPLRTPLLTALCETKPSRLQSGKNKIVGSRSGRP